jgi:hypothetical protein
VIKVRPTKNSTLIILSLLDKNKILLYEEFRKAVIQLYNYFNSMRRTALVLKVSIATISLFYQVPAIYL